MYTLNMNKQALAKLIKANKVNGNKYVSIKDRMLSWEARYELMLIRDSLQNANAGTTRQLTVTSRGVADITITICAVSAPFWSDDISFWFRVND